MDNYKKGKLIEISISIIAKTLHPFNLINRRALEKKLLFNYYSERPIVVGCSVGSIDYLDKEKIFFLPDLLTVEGDLSLFECRNLQELPYKLSVNGSLDLQGCSSLEILPRSLYVGVNLYLRCCSISQLPKDLVVKGHLDVSCTNVKEIPIDMKIPGGLSLSHAELPTLPPIKTLKGDLDLNNSEIRRLPNELTEIQGDLILGGSNIEYLSDSLAIHGRLYVWAAPNLKKLAKKLTVMKDIWFDGSDNDTQTELNSLADEVICESLHFDKYLYPLELPKNLVTGLVVLRNCSQRCIESLEPQLRERGLNYEIGPEPYKLVIDGKEIKFAVKK